MPPLNESVHHVDIFDSPIECTPTLTSTPYGMATSMTWRAGTLNHGVSENVSVRAINSRCDATSCENAYHSSYADTTSPSPTSTSPPFPGP